MRWGREHLRCSATRVPQPKTALCRSAHCGVTKVANALPRSPSLSRGAARDRVVTPRSKIAAVPGEPALLAARQAHRAGRYSPERRASS
jgi:hypothetical protein